MTRDSDRDDLRAAIDGLAARTFGTHVAALEPLPAGLGSRLFFRLTLQTDDPRTVIARVDVPEDPALRPAGVAPEPPLEPLRAFLAAHGLPVPRRYAVDPERGIEFLEDAGPTALNALAPTLRTTERRALFAEACELIARLQSLCAPASEVAAFGRHLDAALFAYKAEQVVEWVLPWALGRAARSAEASVVREAFAWIAEECGRAPERLAHRDYKAENLHVQPGASVGHRLMMIDLQGALLAPPEYDLVSLLRDPQVPLSDDEVREHLEATRPLLPDAPATETLARRFALLTLTRNGKILGRFLYASERRGDRRYLESLPDLVRTLRGAGRAAAAWDPRLERLDDLLQRLPSPELPEAPAPCAP